MEQTTKKIKVEIEDVGPHVWYHLRVNGRIMHSDRNKDAIEALVHYYTKANEEFERREKDFQKRYVDKITTVKEKRLTLFERLKRLFK